MSKSSKVEEQLPKINRQQVLFLHRLDSLECPLFGKLGRVVDVDLLIVDRYYFVAIISFKVFKFQMALRSVLNYFMEQSLKKVMSKFVTQNVMQQLQGFYDSLEMLMMTLQKEIDPNIKQKSLILLEGKLSLIHI